MNTKDVLKLFLNHPIAKITSHNPNDLVRQVVPERTTDQVFREEDEDKYPTCMSDIYDRMQQVWRLDSVDLDSISRLIKAFDVIKLDLKRFFQDYKLSLVRGNIKAYLLYLCLRSLFRDLYFFMEGEG